jgi:hypothetical protein
MAKKIVGLVEEVWIEGRERVRAMALFDTGAKTTSVDVRLAARARLGPIVRTSKISSASNSAKVRRPVVEAKVVVAGRNFDALVNVQDREHMTFPVIIGRDIISGNFMVDTRKNHSVYEKMRQERHD